ncbi:YopX family protein [Agathobacter sp.]
MEDRYLFKAKRLDNGEWVQGNLVYSEDSEDGWETLIIPTRESNMFTKGGSKGKLGFENWYRVDPSTICQCTGLKDKHGELIWENDIIKTFDAGEEWCLSKIIFADTSLGCGWETTDIKSLSKYNNNLFKEVSFGSFDSKSVEIVGNIFDNSELLESEG